VWRVGFLITHPHMISSKHEMITTTQTTSIHKKVKLNTPQRTWVNLTRSTHNNSRGNYTYLTPYSSLSYIQIKFSFDALAQIKFGLSIDIDRQNNNQNEPEIH